MYVDILLSHKLVLPILEYPYTSSNSLMVIFIIHLHFIINVIGVCLSRKEEINGHGDVLCEADVTTRFTLTLLYKKHAFHINLNGIYRYYIYGR